jgi:hypothetical protein
MFCNLSDFARAYQEELLRSSQRKPVDPKSLSKIEATSNVTALREALLLNVGDFLITLGERIKGQSPCPEMTHGQA